MFDFDAGKLVIIGIVALVVIGPKDLPRVMRQVGQAIGKMRRLAADFQGQFMEAMREADVADIKADVAKLADSAKLDIDFNPVRDVRNHIESAVEGPGQPHVEPTPVAALDAPVAEDLPVAVNADVHEPPPMAPAAPHDEPVVPHDELATKAPVVPHDEPATAPHGA